MPRWIPEKKWNGHEVFIIGGGSSLRNFDWNLLKPELTIGCNDAYTLGEEVCKICFFGDNKWFKQHQNKLALYKGAVFTSAPQLYKAKMTWLWTMLREATGFHVNTLGWNENTGASAINLALILGAKRIFLLGFDMCLSENLKANWHTNRVDKPIAKIYEKFLSHEKRMVVDLEVKFPGVEVINVTDHSNLNAFPKISFKAFWEDRKVA